MKYIPTIANTNPNTSITGVPHKLTKKKMANPPHRRLKGTRKISALVKSLLGSG
jgi:hypothetical protein